MDPFHHVHFGRACPPCPQPPPCNCQPNEQCVSTARSCDTCATNSCVPIDDSSSSSKHSVSPGAIAGAVIAAVVFLAVIVLALLWYRRRQRLQRLATAPSSDAKSETPARAEDVLNRPYPHEEKPPTPVQQQPAVRIYGGTSNATINLDPESRGDSVAATNGHIPQRNSAQSNPFTDTHSIQSASTGTQSNVIPIALVPPGSVSMRSGPSTTAATQGTLNSGPMRPERSPDLDLSLNPHSPKELTTSSGKQYAKSALSGMTGLRNSYMTTGSYASDLLNESPVIVTPTRGTVKQVVGVVRAEVIRTPQSSTSVYSGDDQDSPRTISLTSKPSVRSPLARNGAFGPLESMAEEQDQDHQSASESGQELSVRSNPFGDEHSPYRSDAPSSPAVVASPAPTSATFGESEDQHWDPQSPRLPWAKKEERPASSCTQAASIIDANIGTASRVHLGLNQLSPQPSTAGRELLTVPMPSSDLPVSPLSAPLSTARSQYRMTSAKLVSPPENDTELTPTAGGALERQQKRAFENLDARLSQASVLSSTSTRADSILEAFPFVPPSPISDRPIRTPPRSPLAQQAFNGPPTATSSTVATENSDKPLDPPNRKVLGMSTGSQLSTMSNGLSSFPFQIDAGNGPESAGTAGSPPSSFTSAGRQRASLDTLALTADLSSYPLGFDRNEAMAHYPGSRRS